jgi:Mn-dependent DtxR family transcriptional regulator
MLSVVSGKALMLNRKLEYLSIKSLRGKICTFLMEEYNKTSQDTLIMTLKRNELADFLNVSRPSLSREMCKMRDEGMIEFQRENIRITDLEAVKSYAE